jgi:hypothetical protein
MPNPAEVGCKDLPIVHANSQRCRRLYAHRFKQTKRNAIICLSNPR